MITRPPSILAVILVAAMARPAAAQQIVPVLDSVFARWQGTHGPGCTVGVDLAGTRVLRAYGMANLEYRAPLDPESIIESGSVAKQFTAAAVGLLATRGKLGLDDEIRRHLPELPAFANGITIRHLLQHTSGLRDQWALLAIQGFPPGTEVHTLDRIFDLAVHQQRLNFPAGEEYLYSNMGYVLTAIIVQRVAGESLAEFSRRELFEPLGMSRTEWRADYRKVVPGRATAYSLEGGRWVQDMPFTMVYGNGGLLTTVADLLRWNDALTRGTLPGGTAVVQMLETPGKLNDGSAIDYGLGLSVGTFRGQRLVSHGGATAGYRTYLARWPSRSLSVAVLCNAGNADAGGHANQVAIRLLGLSAQELPPSPSVAIDAAALHGFAGSYRDSTTDQVVRFAESGGNLTVSNGGPGLALTHLGNNRFWSPIAGEFRFERRDESWEATQYDDAWRRYRPEPPGGPPAPLTDFIGDYSSPELEVTFKIAAEGDNLVLHARPNSRITLRPAYRDGFGGAGRTVRFVRDRKGTVTGMRIFAGRARDVRFDRVATATGSRKGS